MSELQEVIRDLKTEGDEVEALVADLDESRLTLPTPAPGWTIAHQIAHLTFINELAGMAATDAETFKTVAATAQDDFTGAVNAANDRYLPAPKETLISRWRALRIATADALGVIPPEETVPWLVNPLPPLILACAGIMETFAHGQDIADALEVRRERTDRIKHLVGFAVLTRDFGYLSRGLTPPEDQFRYDLTLPSGEQWEFGPDDATERLSGLAVDFCLLATRRRHRDDLAVKATGDKADHYLDIAQCYRGPAGEGRTPGQFANLDRQPA